MRLINLEGDTNLTLQNQSAVKGQKLGLGPFLAWGDFYVIMEAILKEPATQLHQLASTIQEHTGSEFDVSTKCRALHRLGFTNKKVSINITDTANLFSLSNRYYCF